VGPLKYLLDSTILIDNSNGMVAASQFLLEHHEACFISPVTRAEVLSGLDGGAALTMGRYLDGYAHIEWKKSDSDLAAQLRRRHRWKLPDAFQAAFAQGRGLMLVTRNTKDFNPSRHSFVMVPYRG
jgi:predicted nucleic acid-binding protein